MYRSKELRFDGGGSLKSPGLSRVGAWDDGVVPGPCPGPAGDMHMRYPIVCCRVSKWIASSDVVTGPGCGTGNWAHHRVCTACNEHRFYLHYVRDMNDERLSHWQTRKVRSGCSQ